MPARSFNHPVTHVCYRMQNQLSRQHGELEVNMLPHMWAEKRKALTMLAAGKVQKEAKRSSGASFPQCAAAARTKQ